MKARASRPIWLPVAVHSERLKEHDDVIGSTVLLAHGVGATLLTCETPCAASLHQLRETEGGRAREGGKGVSKIIASEALMIPSERAWK
jgi:hypothetical protein